MSTDTIPLGVGYYGRAEAARLLGLSPSRLRRWVSGYTFWLESEERRRRRSQDPLIHTDLPHVDNTIALSFRELMELRIAKAFVDRGAPLQRVREANLNMRRELGIRHPFASQRVFLDPGRHIFFQLHEEAGGAIVQASGRNRLQLLSGQLVLDSLDEVEFSESTGFTERWWPLGRDFPVVLDPHRAFGAPTVAGSRVRTETIASLARATDAETAAGAFGLAQVGVEAAVRFETLLAA